MTGHTPAQLRDCTVGEVAHMWAIAAATLRARRRATT